MDHIKENRKLKSNSMYEFSKDRNILMRAIRFVELDEQTAREKKVKKYYDKIMAVEHPEPTVIKKGKKKNVKE